MNERRLTPVQRNDAGTMRCFRTLDKIRRPQCGACEAIHVAIKKAHGTKIRATQSLCCAYIKSSKLLQPIVPAFFRLIADVNSLCASAE
jgi:hypothetical protein